MFESFPALSSFCQCFLDFPLFSGEDVAASVGTGFQQLAIEDQEDQEDQEDKPEVIIPNHLQVYTSECSQLIFGSFGSRVEYGQSSGLNYNLEETQETVDDSSFRHQEDHQYKFSSSADYILENSQQLNMQNPHMQNLNTFPYVMVRKNSIQPYKIHHHAIENSQKKKDFNHVYFFFFLLMFSNKDIQVHYPTLSYQQTFKM